MTSSPHRALSNISEFIFSKITGNENRKVKN